MDHKIYRVQSFEIIGDINLRLGQYARRDEVTQKYK